MARSAVELDFFRMEREGSAKPLPKAKTLFDRRRSFRDIQSVISKLNPDILKTVIASGSAVPKPSENGEISASKPSFSVPSTPKHDDSQFPPLPVYTPTFGSNSCGSESGPDTAPLTIFYNGTVAVFDVPSHQAENILKLAEGGVPKTAESADPKLSASSTDRRPLLQSLNRDLPIARKKSLQRFLEKRKERLTLMSPYGCVADHHKISGKDASGN